MTTSEIQYPPQIEQRLIDALRRRELLTVEVNSEPLAMRLSRQRLHALLENISVELSKSPMELSVVARLLQDIESAVDHLDGVGGGIEEMAR